MKKNTWKTYALWIVGTEAVGLIAALLIRDGTRLYAESISTTLTYEPA